MRTVISFLGICVIALGAYWILQGLNLIPGGYATGQVSSTVRGAGTLVAGAAILLLFIGNRR
jgi:hypothetical protein